MTFGVSGTSLQKPLYYRCRWMGGWRCSLNSRPGETELRQSGKKSYIFVAAKKYLKATDALSESERAVSVSQVGKSLPCAARTNIQWFWTMPVPSQLHSLRLCVMSPQHLSQRSMQLGAWEGVSIGSMCQSRIGFSIPTHIYYKCSCFGGECLLYGPLVVGITYMFYGLIALWYLLLHPELLARGIVGAIKASPAIWFQGFGATGRCFWDEVGFIHNQYWYAMSLCVRVYTHAGC